MDVNLGAPGSNTAGYAGAAANTEATQETEYTAPTPTTSKSLQKDSVSHATGPNKNTEVPPRLGERPTLEAPKNQEKGDESSFLKDLNSSLSNLFNQKLQESGLLPNDVENLLKEFLPQTKTNSKQEKNSTEFNQTMNEVLGNQQAMMSGAPQEAMAKDSGKTEEEPPLSEDGDVAEYAKQKGVSPEKAAEKIKAALGPLDPKSVAKLLTDLREQSGGEAIDLDKSPALKELRTKAALNLIKDSTFIMPPSNLPINLEGNPQMAEILTKYVETLLTNPNAPPPPPLNMLSPSIKAELNSINAAVLSGIQSEVSHIATTPAGLEAMTQVQPNFDMALQAVDNAKSQIQARLDYLESLPDFPGKGGMLAYLKIINESINTIRDIIAEMVQNKAQMSRNMTMMMQKETENILKNEAEAQNRIAAELAEKADRKPSKSQKIMKVFSSIMSVVTKALIVGAGVLGGPAGLAFAIAYVSSDKAKAKIDGFMNKAMADVAKGICNACSAMFGEQVGKKIGGGVAMAVTIALLPIFTCGNPMIMMETVAAPGGPIDASLTEAGAFGEPPDPQKRALGLMISYLIIQVIIIIVITVATCGAGTAGASASASTGAASAGAAAGGAAAGGAAAGGAAAATAANTAATTTKMTKMIVAIATLLQLTVISVETARKIEQLNYDIRDLKIEKNLIKERAYLEKMEEIITTLKKMLQKMIDSLVNTVAQDPDLILFFNDSQKKITDSLSEAVSNITG